VRWKFKSLGLTYEKYLRLFQLQKQRFASASQARLRFAALDNIQDFTGFRFVTIKTPGMELGSGSV